MDTYELKNESSIQSYSKRLEKASYRRKIKSIIKSNNCKAEPNKYVKRKELRALNPASSFKGEMLTKGIHLYKSYSFNSKIKVKQNFENLEKIRKFVFLYKQYRGELPKKTNEKLLMNCKAINLTDQKYQTINLSAKGLNKKMINDLNTKKLQKEQKINKNSFNSEKERNNSILNSNKEIPQSISKIKLNPNEIQKIMNFTPIKKAKFGNNSQNPNKVTVDSSKKIKVISLQNERLNFNIIKPNDISNEENNSPKDFSSYLQIFTKFDHNFLDKPISVENFQKNENEQIKSKQSKIIDKKESIEVNNPEFSKSLKKILCKNFFENEQSSTKAKIQNSIRTYSLKSKL